MNCSKAAAPWDMMGTVNTGVGTMSVLKDRSGVGYTCSVILSCTCGSELSHQHKDIALYPLQRTIPMHNCNARLHCTNCNAAVQVGRQMAACLHNLSGGQRWVCAVECVTHLDGLPVAVSNQMVPWTLTIAAKASCCCWETALLDCSWYLWDFSILVMLLRPQLWQMETALADHAVEKLMRGPTSTTAVVSLVCPKRVVGVVNSGSKVSVSSL